MAVSAKLKQLIGKSSKPMYFEVEKSQIRRFAMAIGEENSVHFDEKAAKGAGFSSLVGPPTFASVFHDIDPFLDDLGFEGKTFMHAEEEYEYYQPICAGDTLRVVHKMAEIYDRSAPKGKLIFFVIETRGTDKKAKPVFKGKRLIVELKN